MTILLLDHPAPAAAELAEVLERSSFSASISSADTESNDIGTFEAIVSGTSGAAAVRAEHLRDLRRRGYIGAILALCIDVMEGDELLCAGADDFIAEPYTPLELATRLRACMRRGAARSILRWGAMELDRVLRVVRLGGRTVSLTARECDLLACLIEGGGNVISRERLREQVWRQKEDRGTNLVEVHLSRLREKLGEGAWIIETVRRAGYRLRRGQR